jgi:16S rRNA (uracil1498-N3)-methyltransferase
MRIPRLYYPGPLDEGTQIRLKRDQAVHAERVLRLSQGDAVDLFDGHGKEHRGQIVALSRNAVVVAVAEALSTRPESGLRVCLLQGICRGARMDLVIQKATELGVSRVLPISCARSVVRLDARRAERRLAHWRGIAIAAAEQCGRACLPTVEAPAALGESLAGLAEDGTRLLLSPTADRGLGSLPVAPQEIDLLIGPEGGLTDDERALAREYGFEEYALGPRILRTETAALAALTVVQFLRGDLDGR